MIPVIAALALMAPQPDYDTLRWMALSEFATWATDREQIDKYHDKALPYFKNLPKDELRRELEPIAKKEGSKTRWGAAAAYVMALHGVDVAKNCTRLRSSGSIPFVDYIDVDTPCAAYEALSDIYFRTGYEGALRDLLAIQSDGEPAEEQDGTIDQTFQMASFAYMQIISAEPKLLTDLASALAFDDDGNVKTGDGPIAYTLSKLTKSKKWGKLAKTLKAEVEKQEIYMQAKQ